MHLNAKMNEDLKRELIVKTALEVLQNVMSTNIVDNLEKFYEEEKNEDIDESADDLDDDRFFHELTNHYNQQSQISTSNIEHIDKNDSLTYFEIVEQEMMVSLPVTKESVGVGRTSIRIKFSLVESNLVYLFIFYFRC